MKCSSIVLAVRNTSTDQKKNVFGVVRYVRGSAESHGKQDMRKATCVDGVDAAAYEEDREENRDSLLCRMKRFSSTHDAKDRFPSLRGSGLWVWPKKIEKEDFIRRE